MFHITLIDKTIFLQFLQTTIFRPQSECRILNDAFTLKIFSRKVTNLLCLLLSLISRFLDPQYGQTSSCNNIMLFICYNKS